MQKNCSVLYLVIESDFISLDWFQFKNRFGFVVALQDLPNHLQSLVRPIAIALQQRKIEKCVFDSSVSHFLCVNNQPFDLYLLNIEHIRDQLQLLQWWIGYQNRKSLCRQVAMEKKQCFVWRCECGEEVDAKKELCSDNTCPSWMMWNQCTNKKIRALSCHA